VINVLFLCTGNSARSILAEAILNRRGAGRFIGFSAGSQPRGDVHPLALALLKEKGHDVARLRSKSWDEFAVGNAPRMDRVVTVCDNAAGEACPVWPCQPMSAHWGVPDPAAVQDGDDEKRKMVSEVSRILLNRIRLLTSLPIEKLDRLSLQNKLREIGRAD